MNIPFLNDFVKQFTFHLPPALQHLKSEFEVELKEALHQALDKLDLVTRQEFDIQREVLKRTRMKLEALAERLSQLEKLPAPELENDCPPEL